MQVVVLVERFRVHALGTRLQVGCRRHGVDRGCEGRESQDDGEEAVRNVSVEVCFGFRAELHVSTHSDDCEDLPAAATTRPCGQATLWGVAAAAAFDISGRMTEELLAPRTAHPKKIISSARPIRRTATLTLAPAGAPPTLVHFALSSVITFASSGSLLSTHALLLLLLLLLLSPTWPLQRWLAQRRPPMRLRTCCMSNSRTRNSSPTSPSSRRRARRSRRWQCWQCWQTSQVRSGSSD